MDVYIKCCNGAYYTGSTVDLERRLKQHQKGEGANFTKKHLPVELVYYEEFHRIDHAFYREKQVQGWTRKKKEALIDGSVGKLQQLSECRNETNWKNKPSFGSAQEADFGSAQEADFGSAQEADFDSAQEADFDSAKEANFGSDQEADFDSSQEVEFGSPQKTDQAPTQDTDDD